MWKVSKELMGKSKSITKNAILNGIKTLLSIIFPLITYPYVTRILHSTNLGKVNFAQSIVSYFALIATLGVNTYAVREGAKKKERKDDLNTFCNEIFTTNIITTLIAYSLLIFSILIIPRLHDYSTLIIILSTTMIATTMGVDWINVIFEDYYIITVRSVFVQIINLFFLFIFVKKETDYYIYAFLLVLSNIIICIWNFFYCRKYVTVRLTRHPNIKGHIKPLLVFFANNLAISIYCYADTTMLGWMIGDSCVGIYSVAVKAYTVIKTILASVYSVCIPRLSAYCGQNDYASFKILTNKVFSGILLILLPAMTGLIVLAEPVVLFLGGIEYIEAIPTLRILSFALIFAIVGGFISSCINIPTGKEKISLIGTIVAAVLNIALNVILIPLLKHNGAALTTVIAELAVVVVCCVKNSGIKEIASFKVIGKNTIHALLGCIIVVISYFSISLLVNNIIMQCAFTVLLTIIAYGLLLYALRNEYMRKGIRTAKIFLLHK